MSQIKPEQIKLVFPPDRLNRAGQHINVDTHKFAQHYGIPIVAEVDVTIPTLYVAIGGDGTMLRAYDDSLKQNHSVGFMVSSVVGFHAGTLGFLAQEYDDVEPRFILEQILEGTDWVESSDRMALETTVNEKTHFAVNEFTFTPSSVSSMMDYVININDGFVTEQRGSGVLIATSTGSTAMSVSAGGVIVSPDANIMQIVPLMPHTLTSRPIVTSGDDVINVTSMMERINEVNVHSDGRHLHSFSKDNLDSASIKIKRSQFPVRVWYESDRDFFNILSRKLNW